MNKLDVDYIGILNYLQNNKEKLYLEKTKTVSVSENEKCDEVAEEGLHFASEMNNIAGIISKTFNLVCGAYTTWLDTSGRKVRKYFWIQLKNKENSDKPISISVFAEQRNSDKFCYRVSLEIMNEGVSSQIMEQYHKHLDIQPNALEGLVYVTGSNIWGRPYAIDGSINQIKDKIKSKEYRKVQISKYIDRIPNETNDYYEHEITGAVKALLPYYDYVLNTEQIVYWPSLREYTPGITKEKWIELLKDPRVTSSANLSMFKMMLNEGGEASCTRLAKKYGGQSKSYNGLGHGFAARVKKKTGCPGIFDGKAYRTYPIAFQGRYVFEDGQRRYSWKLRDELKEALEEVDLSGIDVRIKKDDKNEFDKNIILYGPPGTGKTYNSAIYAVAICDNTPIEDLTDYDAVMQRYNELKEEHRIVFTTFHQSYGYEEFIEGIKPTVSDSTSEISYSIESGIFKRFCERARIISEDRMEYTGNVWAVRNRAGDNGIPDDFEKTIYADGVIKIEDITDCNRQCDLLCNMELGDWIVLGRNYEINAIGVITDDGPAECEDDIFRYQRSVAWKATGLQVDCRKLNGGKSFSNFAIAKSSIKVQDLQKIVDAEAVNDEPFVFVIDEINRGNISKIFGELITLIENTKRDGMPEAVSTVLPYSGELFSVPSNVYILGTMNTADRSIAIMDTALRRRFQFVEMLPQADVLREIGADKVIADGKELDVAKMLETINERISFLYDREHTIGHAFFTGLAQNSSIEKLASIFSKSVIPLLQEYFYEDYQKIQLVLGDNSKSDNEIKFIRDIKVVTKDIFKGNVDEVIDLPEKKYEINEKALMNIQSYLEII